MRGLYAAAALNAASLSVFRVVLSYLLIAFGDAALLLGLSLAVFAIPPLLLSPFIPVLLASRFVSNLIAMIGSLVLGVAALILFVIDDAWWLVAVSGVAGVGQLLFALSAERLVSSAAAGRSSESPYGHYTAAISVGQIIGPLVAGGILSASLFGGGVEEAGLAAAIVCCIAGALAALAVGIAYVRGAHGAMGVTLAGFARLSFATAVKAGPKMARAVAGADGSSWSLFRDSNTRSAVLCSAAVLALVDVMTIYLPLVGERAGLSEFTVGLLLSLRAIASMLARLSLQSLVDLFGRTRLLSWCLAISAFAVCLFPFLATSVVAAVFVALLAGSCLGLGQPLTISILASSVRREDLGRALVMRLTGNRVSQLIFPLLASATSRFAGVSGPFVFCSVLALVLGASLVFSDSGRRA